MSLLSLLCILSILVLTLNRFLIKLGSLFFPILILMYALFLRLQTPDVFKGLNLMVNRKNIPPTLYRVHLSFVDAKDLYTAFEIDLGLFDRMSTAEHIRRMIAASNVKYKVLLTATEVPNPRLSYDLSVPCDYRIF